MSDNAWTSASVPAWEGGHEAPSPRASAAAFASAARHSGLVRFLRRAIPIGSAAAVVALIAVSVFNPFGQVPEITMGPIAMSGTKVTMEKPRMSGFRKDNKPYEVTAVSASQDVRKPNIAELHQITGRVNLEPGNSAHLEALDGVFDMKSEKLELSGKIKVTTDNGYKAELSTAQVDFKSGGVTTKDPVQIMLNDGGTVSADSMDMSDNGKRIIFQGRVRTVLPMQNHDAKGMAPGQAPADHSANSGGHVASPAAARSSHAADGQPSGRSSDNRTAENL